jgi:hypothetical protein
MNTDWKPFYKIRNGIYSSTNLLYAPMINPAGNIMCMDWSLDNTYHNNPNRTHELIDFFFEREVRYINIFKNYSWAPKILEIDLDKKQIYIEWNTETLNTVLFVHNTPISDVCIDWKIQQYTILKDIKDAGYYKMSLYPHCFFLDKHNKLKTFDFYGCVEIDNPYIERNKISGMIGSESGGRFDNSTTNGIIDFSVFFKNTLLTHLDATWPDNPFPDYYTRLYE